MEGQKQRQHQNLRSRRQLRQNQKSICFRRCSSNRPTLIWSTWYWNFWSRWKDHRLTSSIFWASYSSSSPTWWIRCRAQQKKSLKRMKIWIYKTRPQMSQAWKTSKQKVNLKKMAKMLKALKKKKYQNWLAYYKLSNFNKKTKLACLLNSTWKCYILCTKTKRRQLIC